MMITLGDVYTDKITGFKGTATARVEYITGCVQFCLEPKIRDVDPTKHVEVWFDEGRLVAVKKREPKKSSGPVQHRRTGGSMPSPPPRSGPGRGTVGGGA